MTNLTEHTAPARLAELTGSDGHLLFAVLPKSIKYEDEAALTRVADTIDKVINSHRSPMLAPGSPGELIQRVARLTPYQAADLVITAVNAEIIEPHVSTPEEMTERVLGKLRGIYGTEALAAWNAVRQLGGHHRVGIKLWQMGALLDSENPPCHHVMDAVVQAASSTAPGRHWFDSLALGVLLFEHA